jgi:hypothetical protein
MSFSGQAFFYRRPEKMFISPEILDSSEIPAEVKTLLRTLLDFADKRGECYPGQIAIARRMSRSVRSVRRYIKLAVELRLISVRHRWLNTSVYHLLCLVPPKVIHKADTDDLQTYPLKSYKTTIPKTNGREIKICLEDSREILGESTFKRNYNWLRSVIWKIGYDAFQDALQWLRQSLMESAINGSEIRCPSALLNWKIRQFVTV